MKKEIGSYLVILDETHPSGTPFMTVSMHPSISGMQGTPDHYCYFEGFDELRALKELLDAFFETA
jgi:hypothetical protein